MVTMRKLCPEYQNFNYRATIEMLDNVSPGLLARFVSEVSELKRGFIATNDEANVQDFSEDVCEVAGQEWPIDGSDDRRIGSRFSSIWVSERVHY